MALNWDKLNKQSNPTNNVKTLDWSKINTTPTNSKAQLNAYNTLLNATNVRTYNDAKKYGAGNIDLTKRPIVKNEDGTISTVRSMSFNDGGKEILIPTVVNGEIVSDNEAIEHYYKTGEYLGKFNTIEEADSYAKKLHEEQERMYTSNINKSLENTRLSNTPQRNMNTFNQKSVQDKLNQYTESKKKIEDIQYKAWSSQPAEDVIYRDNGLTNGDVDNLDKLNLKYYGKSGSADAKENYIRDYLWTKKQLYSAKTGKDYSKAPTLEEYIKDVENYEAEKDKTFKGKVENVVQKTGQAIKTMANASTSTVTNIYDSVTKPDFKVPVETKNITAYNPEYSNKSLIQIAKNTSDKEIASKLNQANHAIGQLELWAKTYATKGEAKQVMDNLIAELKNGTYQGTDEDVENTIEQVKTIIANENKTTWANDLYAKTLEENEYRYSEPAKKFVNALGTATEQLPTLTMAVAGGAPASTFDIYSSAEGSAYKQALNEGATDTEAKKYARGVALAETGIETLAGGVTNKVLGIPGFINMTNNITNPYVRGFVNYTGDILGESFEEGISGVIEPYIRRATYDPNAGFENFGEALTAFTDNYVQSILPTMLMSAGTNIVNTMQMARVKKDIDNYYNEFENVIKASNLVESQKQEAIGEIEKVKKEVLKQVFNQDENLQNTTQNNTNITQTSPNTENISQNNVQNVSNLENIVQNTNDIEKSENAIYNEAGGVEDGRIEYKLSKLVERESQNIEATEKILKAQPQITEKNLTLQQKNTKNTAIKKYNKNIIYYDGSNVTAKGLATNTNNIYIDNESSKTYGSDFVLGHEIAEDMIFNHSNEVMEEFDNLIMEIQKSKSFTQMYREYAQTLSSKQKQDLVFKLDKVAKEIFCDINGGRNTTQSQDITEQIKNQLGEELYNKIVSTLDKYEKQIYSKENSTQGSFLMPSTEQLQAQDKKQGEEIYNTLNMKKTNNKNPNFMLVNEKDSYKRNMINNNAKAINDLIRAKNETIKDIEKKIAYHKQIDINIEDNYSDTINELNAEKIYTLQTINEKIQLKQEELASKKDKTTKIAQSLQGQIANLEARKVKTDSEYDNRIERLKNIQLKNNAKMQKKNNVQIIALEKRKADIEQDYIKKIDRLVNKNATINKQVSEDRLPTRKEIKEKIITEKDLDSYNFDDIQEISKFKMNNTTPERVMEKIFDRETATNLNNNFIKPIKHNEAERIRFINAERQEIQSLGIKPKSAESSAIQKYGEGVVVDETTGQETEYTLKDLQTEFPNDWEKIKNASEVIRNKYDTYLDTINQILNENGYDSIPKLKNYFRHFEAIKNVFDQIGIPTKENTLPTDMNGLTADLKPGKNFFANALSRTGKKTTYDAITGIDGYLEGASKMIYHTEDIQKLRALDDYIRKKYSQQTDLSNLKGEEFNTRVEQIQNNHLSEFASWLTEYTNNLAGKKSKMDRGTEEALGRKVYGTLNFLKKQVGSNLTGLNINSALSNFISITQSASKTSKIAMGQGLGDTLKNIFANDGFINKSDFLTRRFGSDKLSKTWWEKASNAGQIFMSGTDYFSANLITRSKYHEYLNKGYPEAEAIKKADEFADRLMGGRALGDMPNIFNSKTLGILTQFQLENVNQFDSMFHDTKYENRAEEQTQYEAKTWNEKIKSNLAKSNPKFYNGLTATFILGQLFTYAWLFNKADEELTGSPGAFDPFGLIEKTIKDFTNPDITKEQATKNLVKNIIDQIPYANTLTGGGRVPMSDALPNLYEILEENTSIGSEAWKLLNLGLPTGGGQIRKSIQGATALAKGGDYTSDGRLKFPIAQEENKFLEGAQALLFGKWATPGGKKYIENGFKALSQVQTEGLEKAKELDISIKEFYDIMEKIKDIEIPKRKNKEGKDEAIPGARKKLIINELNKTDLNDKQKKLMYDIFYKQEVK